MENSYIYPADPVNEFDLTGTIGYKKWFNDRWSAVKNGAKWSWDKRNQFGRWHQKHAPWLSDALILAAAARGGKGAKGFGSKNQYKLLSKNEIKALQRKGYDIHDIKGGRPATKDLYKDSKGNIYVQPKGGSPYGGERTGINIKNFGGGGW